MSLSTLSGRRPAKRARLGDQQALLNPLAMMMGNPMAAMAQLNQLMNPGMAAGMPLGANHHDGGLQDDHDEEEATENDPVSSSASVGAASSPASGNLVAAVPRAPAMDVPVAPVVAGLPVVGVDDVRAGAGVPVPREDDDNEHTHQRLQDAVITRSATYLKNIARNRLSDVMEKMVATMDSTYTAELSRNGLLCLLWIMTRVKPGVKISDLRSLGYPLSIF